MPIWFEVLIAAIIGALISVVGFGLFIVAQYVICRRLEAVAVYVYELWLAFIAPVIGGVVGAAIFSNAVSRGIYIIAIGALIGGTAIPVLESIIGDRGNRRARNIIQQAIAGMGYGTINGTILAVIFAILKVLGWR